MTTFPPFSRRRCRCSSHRWCSMSSDIIVSLIALLGSAVGTFGGILLNVRLTNYRIEQLEKKVDRHNNVIERVYLLEKADAVEEEEIKVINHRLSDLEQYHK